MMWIYYARDTIMLSDGVMGDSDRGGCLQRNYRPQLTLSTNGTKSRFDGRIFHTASLEAFDVIFFDFELTSIINLNYN